jgi:hypothetical protein
MKRRGGVAIALGAFTLAVLVGVDAATALPISQLNGQSWRTACTRTDGTVSTVCCTRHANDCLADCGSLGGAAKQQCENDCTAAWNLCKAPARGIQGGTTIFQQQTKPLELAPAPQ